MNMKLQAVVDEIKKLNDKSYKRFELNLVHLLTQLQLGVRLRAPYRLILDSNIVMRLESLRNGVVAEGILAILLAFIFAKRLPFQMDMVIRPVVFYEFLRKRNVTDVRDHWEGIKALTAHVNTTLGVTLYFDGATSFRDALNVLSLIETDAAMIKARLREYQEADWTFNYVRPPGAGFTGTPSKEGNSVLTSPSWAAEGLYRQLDLSYIDSRVAGLFLREHMRRGLIEWPKNDKQVAKYFKEDSDFVLARILKLSINGNLSGLGDVDVFRALLKYSHLSVHAGPLVGSRDPKVLDGHAAAMEAFVADQQRIAEGDERFRTAESLFYAFLDELVSMGALRKDKLPPPSEAGSSGAKKTKARAAKANFKM